MEGRRLNEAAQPVQTFAELAAQEKGYRFPAGVPTTVEWVPGARIGVGAVTLSIQERVADDGPANLVLVGPDGQETPIRDIQKGTALNKLTGTVVARGAEGKTTLNLDDPTVSRGVHCAVARVEGTKQLVVFDAGSGNGVRAEFEAPKPPAQAAGPAERSAAVFTNQHPAAKGPDGAKAAEQQVGVQSSGEITAAMAAFRRGLLEGKIIAQAAQQKLTWLRQAAGAYKGSDAEIVQAALSNVERTYQEVAGAQPARSDARAQQAARPPQSPWPAPPGLSTGGEVAAKRSDQAPAQFRQTAQEVQAAGGRRMGGLPDNPTIQQVEQIFNLGAVLTPAEFASLQGRNDVLINMRPGGVQLHILEVNHEDAHHNFIWLEKQKGGAWKVVGTSNHDRA